MYSDIFNLLPFFCWCEELWVKPLFPIKIIVHVMYMYFDVF